jgi:methyltransferase family protein
MSALVSLNEMVQDGFNAAAQSAAACKVCGESAPLFDVVDFNRACHPERYLSGLAAVPVYYHRCIGCDLVFTSAFDRFTSDGWRKHVYNEVYYDTFDTEYETVRPHLNAELMRATCRAHASASIRGLDYGGGHGRLAKILQDSGIAYATYDPYGYSDKIDRGSELFNVISSFEVLEHTASPRETIEDLLTFAANEFVLVASTQTSDDLIDTRRRLNWTYVAPRNGHVTIYSRKALACLAEQYSLDYLQVSRGLHLFGRGTPLTRLKYAAGLVKLKQKMVRPPLSVQRPR